MANKFANFVHNQGLRLGDCAAIMMYNEPSFIWSYLGFAKLGIKCALINYNMRARSLLNCIEITGARVLLVGHDNHLISYVEEISSQLHQQKTDIWTTGGKDRGIFWHIDRDLSNTSNQPVPREIRGQLQKTDTSVYIFTSGTTGLPKASVASHTRHVRAAFTLTSSGHGLTSKDRIYVSLPLYHSSGFYLGFATAVNYGSSMVLTRKFSSHKFWDDCRRHSVTVIQYIGEVCRYLLTLPEHPDDRKHSVRMAVGNGLKADIWSQFKNRFNIPIIYEFYGATEGNFLGLNFDNTVGAVARSTPLLKFLMGFHLIKFDNETAEVIRGPNGRCIPVKFGEPGLLITEISDRIAFEGYHGNKKLTEEKISRNVFKDGDAYLNSGDVMILDKNYYLYFVDRLGDTFRWKGENVSTTEVASVLTMFPGINEANVYGVQVPGQDGRAGMAAIVFNDEQECDMQQLYNHVTKALPLYACPMFLRITQTLETTGTYKYKKKDLMRDGFDPGKTSDKLYFKDFTKKTYSPLNKGEFQKIVFGKARL
ncbi:long-chain fatty acid transport protein 2-like [Saccoglossus kowalevskii]